MCVVMMFSYLYDIQTHEVAFHLQSLIYTSETVCYYVCPTNKLRDICLSPQTEENRPSVRNDQLASNWMLLFVLRLITAKQLLNLMFWRMLICDGQKSTHLAEWPKSSKPCKHTVWLCSWWSCTVPHLLVHRCSWV